MTAKELVAFIVASMIFGFCALADERIRSIDSAGLLFTPLIAAEEGKKDEVVEILHRLVACGNTYGSSFEEFVEIVFFVTSEGPELRDIEKVMRSSGFDLPMLPCINWVRVDEQADYVNGDALGEVTVTACAVIKVDECPGKKSKKNRKTRLLSKKKSKKIERHFFY